MTATSSLPVVTRSGWRSIAPPTPSRGLPTCKLRYAAPILHHLDKTFPCWAPLVAEARSKIDVNADLHQVWEQDLGDRQALEYMRELLQPCKLVKS